MLSWSKDDNVPDVKSSAARSAACLKKPREQRSCREVSGAGWCFELTKGAATSRGGMGLYNVGCRRNERSICGFAGDVDRTDGDR